MRGETRQVLDVMIEQLPAPDAQGRLARAFDVILRAAARAINKTDDKPAEEPRSPKEER